MFKIIKNFNWIILSSFLCIFMGVVTFLTFINEGFVPLTENNLLTLLIIDILLLLVFFGLIFKNFYRFYYTGKKNKKGAQTNLKYISVFSLFTVIPSLVVAIFSLFIFNFGVQNYFDKQITKAVNNSYDVAKNYLDESKENVLSDVILMSVGLNRASVFYYSNQNQFKNIIRSEKILRRIDDVYLIDSLGNILISDVRDITDEFFPYQLMDVVKRLGLESSLLPECLDLLQPVGHAAIHLANTYLPHRVMVNMASPLDRGTKPLGDAKKHIINRHMAPDSLARTKTVLNG